MQDSCFIFGDFQNVQIFKHFTPKLESQPLSYEIS